MDKIDNILNLVEKPARYSGGEYNRIIKDRETAVAGVALCFPDVYEIGMSNLGMRIIYAVLNAIGNVRCERVFAPWPDMEAAMREQGVALYSLESRDAVKDFDIIAFSLGYELSYTNVLNMLSLAGVNARSAGRGEDEPLVIAGGTCCFNPGPLSDFIDLFVIGEGEEAVAELIKLYTENKEKEAFLTKAAKLTGIYIPKIHDRSGVQIKKRIVNDLDSAFFPVSQIVPSMEIVHDRAVVELFRGCTRGCRFCQAGHIYNPMRMRSVQKLKQQAAELITNTGYDEIALLSLSTGDYKYLNELCDELLNWCEPRKVNLSLPSLRADSFNVALMQRVQKVRKSGLTFAPEAGTQRLRDFINKKITEEELLEACGAAFAGGWNNIKLYFMLGLPTETDEDAAAIGQLAHKVTDVWLKTTNNRKRGVRITVTTSCFIPKPHTPFEREEQISIEEYLRRVEIVRNSIHSKKIVYNWHSPEQGYIEAALSRGDRELGRVIETAWRDGARFDAWSEHFSLERWQDAFKECKVDIDCYATRKRPDSEELPWSFIRC